MALHNSPILEEISCPDYKNYSSGWRSERPFPPTVYCWAKFGTLNITKEKKRMKEIAANYFNKFHVANYF